MSNFELHQDETVLREEQVTSSIAKGNLFLTLTDKRIVFEKEKGMFVKIPKAIKTIYLEDIVFNNDVNHIKQKSYHLILQTSKENIEIAFIGMLNASTFRSRLEHTLINSIK